MNDFVAQVKEEKRIQWPTPTRADHADGIYFRMPEEEYHADSALGASGICDLTVSPLAFWMKSNFNTKRIEDEKDDKETAATIRGTYFHEALAGSRSTIVVKPKGMSFATKEGKEFKADRPGATFIKAEHAEQVQIMIDAMRETGALERVGGVGGGISEVSFFWTDKIGRRRKIRADRLLPGPNGVEAFDWKTMANTMNKDTETLVAHTVAQHRYHIKAYWYQTGFQAMKAMINHKGHAAFMTETAETEYAAMLAMSQTEAVVPFWYLFIENSGVPNIIARKFVAHDPAKQLNAYFRAAKQETERALAIFDSYMDSHGPANAWHYPVPFKDFADEDFSAARWILAEE